MSIEERYVLLMRLKLADCAGDSKADSAPVVVCSMSRKGNCWDNAPAESFFNSLKNERVHGRRYATRAEAIADLFEYIEVFYNRSRRHSTLGYCSPVQFLQDWTTNQQGRKLAA